MTCSSGRVIPGPFVFKVRADGFVYTRHTTLNRQVLASESWALAVVARVDGSPVHTKMSNVALARTIHLPIPELLAAEPEQLHTCEATLHVEIVPTLVCANTVHGGRFSGRPGFPLGGGWADLPGRSGLLPGRLGAPPGVGRALLPGRPGPPPGETGPSSGVGRALLPGRLGAPPGVGRALLPGRLSVSPGAAGPSSRGGRALLPGRPGPPPGWPGPPPGETGPSSLGDRALLRGGRALLPGRPGPPPGWAGCSSREGRVFLPGRPGPPPGEGPPLLAGSSAAPGTGNSILDCVN